MAIRVGRIGYFVSKINTDGSFGKVQNVGIQLPKDDFGYWIDTKSRRGFLLKQSRWTRRMIL
jgi:hypothetical protein